MENLSPEAKKWLAGLAAVLAALATWLFSNTTDPTTDTSDAGPPVVVVDAAPPATPDASPPDAAPPVVPDAAPPVFTGWSCGPGLGTDYPVGPAFAMKSLADVPWTTLAPGDTVRLHWRAEPYRERVLISVKGTEGAPIKVCGVPGPEGQRPVVDGQNSVAVASANWRSDAHKTYGLFLFYARAGQAWDERPEHIIIEGLELRNAFKAYGNWAQGAAGVRIIDGGDYITIRHNVIRNNSNGVLQSSGGAGKHLSEYLVVEYNEFDGNGGDTADGSRSHAMYVQGYRPLIQGNYIHSPRTPGESTGIKDRSPGTVIRYNWVDTDTIALDLVEPQEHNSAVASLPEYHTAHVYGNVLVFRGDGRVVHFGGDVGMGDRKGPLYFYHNTVHIVAGATTWSNSLIDVDADDGVAYSRNNVVWRDNGRADGLGVTLIDRNGTLYTENDYVGPKWTTKKSPTYQSTVVGTDTVTTLASPGWVDYLPSVRHVAVPLMPEMPLPLMQYKPTASVESRVGNSTAGAFE